jgi:transcription elongation GreA/GreB family factor
MRDIFEIKQSIYLNLHDLIDQRIATAKAAIASVEESRDSETKSSAGDKHETGRAIMQSELERNKKQLQAALELKNEISRINIDHTNNVIKPGCLVFTNHDNYFISTGLGKMEIDDDTYYFISAGAPLGKALLNKRKGDTFNFLDKEFVILNVQ